MRTKDRELRTDIFPALLLISANLGKEQFSVHSFPFSD